MSDNTYQSIAIGQVDKSQATGEHARVGVKSVDGTWYGCFKPDLWPELVEGRVIYADVKLSPNGKFRNIVGLGQSPAANSHPTSGLDREMSIRRQVALKCATELVVAHGGEYDDPAAETLKIANLFAAWLETSTEEVPF